MKTEIVIIIKKPGRDPKVHLLRTVKTNRHLEDFRREFTRVIAQTKANRRELKKYQKKRSLRYFLRNLRQAFGCRINAACDMIVGSPSAAEIEYIGLEDGQ
jgi:hypothetical protein